MNKDWQEWISINLKQGCAAAEILQILREQNFPGAEIREAMGDDYPNLTGIGQENPHDPKTSHHQVADYVRMARPGLVVDHERGLSSESTEKIDVDELMQLHTIRDFLNADG